MHFQRKSVGVLLLGFFLAQTGCSNQESEMTGGQGPSVREIQPEAPQTSGIPPQAFGFYSRGRLQNDSVLPLEGAGLLKVFRARNRNYITQTLADIIEGAAGEIHSMYPGGERLQVGDVAKHGGGQLSLHASHQNGLDADLAYYRISHREMNPEGFGGFDEKFVVNGKVTNNLDLERNYEFFKILVSTNFVNRIFVDATIKSKLCQLSEGHNLTALDRETLRRLRPLENHDDHFHLRIKCPSTSPDCVTQVEPPAGTGCPTQGQILLNMFDPSED